MKDIQLLPNIFPEDIDIEYHHLLNDFYSENKYCWFIVPLPKITHNYIAGNKKDKEHWKFNTKWINKAYGIEVKELLTGTFI